MNKRITVLYEGITTSDGRYLQPGSVRWDHDESLPVIAYDDGVPVVVGLATDPQRHDDGAISIVVSVDEGMFDSDVGSVSAELCEVKSGLLEGHLSIREGRLHGFMLLATNVWPWPDKPQDLS